MTDYIDTADQAKLIRKALKESFPGQKFSVRISRYSGGSSIGVSWTDGPTTAQVEKITDRFKGSYFDGMTDYKGSNHHMMNGRAIHFGGDFVFTSRKESDALRGKALAALKRLNPHLDIVQDATLESLANGAGWNVRPSGTAALVYRDSKRQHSALAGNLQEALNGQLSNMTDRYAKRSPTADSIICTGDDGYGYGATGPRAHLEVVK